MSFVLGSMLSSGAKGLLDYDEQNRKRQDVLEDRKEFGVFSDPDHAPDAPVPPPVARPVAAAPRRRARRRAGPRYRAGTGPPAPIGPKPEAPENPGAL